MSDAPPRHKPRDEWSPDEILAHQRTGKAPESAEYRDYVRQVHEDAGLEPPEQEADQKAIEDMSPDEHFDRIRRGP